MDRCAWWRKPHHIFTVWIVITAALVVGQVVHILREPAPIEGPLDLRRLRAVIVVVTWLIPVGISIPAFDASKYGSSARVGSWRFFPRFTLLGC